MKTGIKYFILSFLMLFYGVGFCFADDADSLKNLLANSREDSSKVNLMLTLSKNYFSSDPVASLFYGNQAKQLSVKLQFNSGFALACKNIGIGHYMLGKYVEAIQNWNEALKMYEQIGDRVGVANMYSNLGAIYFNQADDAKALEFYLKSLKIAEEENDTLRIATVLMNIGAVYFNKTATYDKALEYYLRALPLSEIQGDFDAIGTVSVNLGEIYFAKGEKDLALKYFEKSLLAFEGSENIPYSYIYIGKVYASEGDFEKAIQNQQKAFEIASSLDGKLDMTRALLALGETYQSKGENKKAIVYYLDGKELGIEIRANIELKDIYKGLSECYGNVQDYLSAFKYQNLLLDIKDTLYNLETDKKLGSLLFNFEIEKKEGQINILTKDREIKEQELQRQKLVRNGFIGGFAIVLLFAGVFFMQRNRIANEKQKSDNLLLNILPHETAEELKATGSAEAKSFNSVSVLFTDFKNFTQASELLSAHELVQEINHCYCEFDRIIERHGIEKIKTIGDAYMCAGGLPAVNSTHPQDVINAGLEMVDFIRRNKIERQAKGQTFFELRLGIHTGPVVAGIVGIKKFAYDIWGDTVNIAARMESSGEVGRVNISETTYELIKEKFNCTPRGKIEAKNKGSIEMYFVNGAV